ncbi:MAG: hypothetical protein IJY39_02230 [Clostridia bacterium]|nr:hypothetical protein [Clostridia bacterium]
MLPEVKKVKMPSLTLPTAWQTVIFRNFGYVRAERIAEVLGCDVQTVHCEAERLRIKAADYSRDFEERGYITIIRNNWFLLPYDQLMTLLGIDERKLDFILEKDDFLSVKLGNFKPECPAVGYFPLTKEQIAETEGLAKTLARYAAEPSAHPFDFFTGENTYEETVTTACGKRIVHGYLSPCGDAFATDCNDTLPEALLAEYQRVGVNGIWLHGVLSSLSPYPFLPELSEGYEQRRKNMNKIIERCKKYGISLYLYMNEPRALPAEALPEYEGLIGWQERRTLCMEKAEVREYLYEAVRDLCASVPQLGGIFTITMSENPTHCNYVNGTECPVCKNIPPENSTSAINNIFLRAMRDAGCEGELIANLWGWSPYMCWSEEQILNGIRMLDKDIAVMSVSEFDLEIEKGGVKSRVIDYSISNPGPSDISIGNFQKARETGHKNFAKIQASNSWECSAVPYIPVFDLVFEHLEGLGNHGVNDFFLTWTQGGYPSPSVEIASGYHKGFDLDAWYSKRFGEQAEAVHKGIRKLCEAFREYPFSIRTLYMSPKTLGSANLWDLTPEEKSSTMVCFAYDDFEGWIYPYPVETYLSQLDKQLSLWREGIAILADVPESPLVSEILRYAKVAYLHFDTDRLQTRFAIAKRATDYGEMLNCVLAERENAESLLSLVRSDAKIGYEASNHYFYTERNLLEKILRMDAFASELQKRIRA